MTLQQRTIRLRNGDSVSAVLAAPAARREASTCVVLAHGAGNDMHGSFLSAVHRGIAAHGHPCVKFNFPYKERGRRAPDRASVLEACYEDVLAALREEPAPARLIIGGKSLGGRMASHLAARGEAVHGLLFLGYPLHPAGRPDKLRVAHLGGISVPMLFIAGTRDPLCDLRLLRRAVRSLRAPVDVHLVDGGDHSFNIPKSMKRDVAEVWDDVVVKAVHWLATLDTTTAGRPARRR